MESGRPSRRKRLVVKGIDPVSGGELAITLSIHKVRAVCRRSAGQANDEFADAVMGMVDVAEPFAPRVTYIPEGDCLEFVAAPDDYYAERIDGLVTVFYSRQSGEIIGSLIKGIKGFCDEIARKSPGFLIEIKAGPVQLSHLFRARFWTEATGEDPILVATYRKLIRVAEEAGVTAELSPA